MRPQAGGSFSGRTKAPQYRSEDYPFFASFSNRPTVFLLLSAGNHLRPVGTVIVLELGTLRPNLLMLMFWQILKAEEEAATVEAESARRKNSKDEISE
ncbi:hypothetical protein R1flu_007010 [Riccia fluitans]|uniref:Uncharacterized protein n=1 Tax=Riccia fluitans TaxID=41844 RepID=A0ABD1YXN4_9MARC